MTEKKGTETPVDTWSITNELLKKYQHKYGILRAVIEDHLG
jgi:hypothetical protein